MRKYEITERELSILLEEAMYYGQDSEIQDIEESARTKAASFMSARGQES